MNLSSLLEAEDVGVRPHVESSVLQLQMTFQSFLHDLVSPLNSAVFNLLLVFLRPRLQSLAALALLSPSHIAFLERLAQHAAQQFFFSRLEFERLLAFYWTACACARCSDLRSRPLLVSCRLFRNLSLFPLQHRKTFFVGVFIEGEGSCEVLRTVRGFRRTSFPFR